MDYTPIAIEFTPAEILHIASDRPTGGLVGPRFTAWSKLAVAANEVLQRVLPDEDEKDAE